MAVARLQPLVLKPRQTRSSPQERWVAALFAVAIFSALIWAVYTLLGNPFADWDWDSFAKGFRAFLEQLPVEKQLEGVLLVVAIGAQLWFMRRISKYERLNLDQTGIRYTSPLPDPLRRLKPDWSLQWSQVRGIRIVVPKAMFHPNLVTLEFDAGSVKRRLQALHWSGDAEGKTAEAETWRERFLLGLRAARERDGALRKVEQSPLVRYAKEAGVKVTTGDAPGIGFGFALEKHRHALVATVLVLSLLCYAVVDFAMNEEVYAVDPPLVLFGVAGAIAVLVSMLWLVSAGVPRAETLGLSLLLGAAAGAALYPGLLRVNEATDDEGLRAHDYRLTEYVVFSPLDPNLPVMTFPGVADYWRQFKIGTIHRFELRKGGLGFYQVNMQPVHEKMREYFSGRK
jgi:hypothetical protein